jgi:hypothetical protein
MSGCTSIGPRFLLTNVRSGLVYNCSFSSGNGLALSIGKDADSGGQATTITVERCTATSTGTHGALIGHGATGCVVKDLTSITNGDYGLVVKSCSGNTISGGIFSGGAGSARAALYLKGCSANTIDGSILISDASGKTCIYIQASDSGTKPSGNTLRNLLCKVSAGSVFAWAAAQDGGTHVVDYNRYRLCGTGTWGTVQAATPATLATVRTAWGDTNDSHSTTDAALGLADAAKVMADTDRGDGTMGTIPLASVMQSAGGNIPATDVRDDTETGIAAGGDLHIVTSGTIGEALLAALAIKAKTDLIGSNDADSPAQQATQATIADKLDEKVSEVGGGSGGGITDEQWGYIVRQLGLIGSAEVTMNGPMLASGDFLLVQGNDRTLSWTIKNWALAVPDSCKVELTTANAYSAGGVQPAKLLELTATCSLSGSTLTISAPITATQSNALPTSPPNQANYIRAEVRMTYGSNTISPLFASGTVVRKVGT